MGTTSRPVQSLRILFLDPHLGDPNYGRDQAAWFALESAAYSLPDACVLLLTPSCLMSNDVDNDNVHQHIYQSSLPLFRSMIERGLVR